MSMYPIPDGFVPAYNTITGEKRHVPPSWLDESSPWPGQWSATPASKATASADPAAADTPAADKSRKGN